jgi:hypothetical protein
VSQNPESVGKHDPYINDLFIDIFRQEDMKDLACMFRVGLAINDPFAMPAVPIVPMPPSGSTLVNPATAEVHPATDDQDVVAGRDKDGDQMRVSYVHAPGATQGYDCDAAIIFRVSAGGFLMPIERVPAFIAWLNSRVAKHAKGQS